MASQEEIFKILKDKFGEAIREVRLEAVDPFTVFDPDIVEELCLFSRDDPRLRFDLLSLISAVDYPASPPRAEGAGGSPPRSPEGAGNPGGRIEVVYFLDSSVHKHRLILKAILDRDNPRIRTVENVWRAADWHEREAFDLMGVIFEGHHNLVRILCAEDWEGHPLRKDYVIPDTYHGIKNVVY